MKKLLFRALPTHALNILITTFNYSEREVHNPMKKMKKQGGFTLVEMLIVVAIIAILIAISIPLVNNALERAKHATDAANERSAKAEVLINYLGDGSGETTGYYDAAAGSVNSTSSNIAGYGKHGGHKDQILYVECDTDGVVTMAWCNEGTSTAPSGTALKAGFCTSHDYTDGSH